VRLESTDRSSSLWTSKAFKLGAIALVCAAAFAAFAAANGEKGLTSSVAPVPPPLSSTQTELGINLFGLASFNRQQVYLNLISQSEWFSSKGDGWTRMPAAQLDENGWVRQLEQGQTAPRPLIIPPAPFRTTQVRCQYKGRGELSTGGLAQVRSQGDGFLMIELTPTGAADEGAWIELLSTDPTDPVRNIDCRETDLSQNERFHPDFLEFVQNFKIIRFLDWQRINDNLVVDWANRTTLEDSSQSGPAGASVEDMVDLANRTGADPWLLVPYKADDAYILQFAQLVHDRLDPQRTVYVELGNEVWNDMFDAAQQAQREGTALKLGGGDPKRAQMIRYAQKVRGAMKIWTEVFADRPDKLVRVASSQHVWTDLARYILEDADTAHWVDALATAPYIWLDMEGMDVSDVDRVFDQMPGAIDYTMKFAEENRAIAAAHGKDFIAYEGGQHLVTSDLDLARAVQRDPRMANVYMRYLSEWDRRIRSAMTLYASTAPIADYGSWGLMEYAGQTPEQAPKLRGVYQFQKERAR